MSFDKLATKYAGDAAENYERVRAGKKWDAEHEAVEELLAFVASGARVLDVPTGTGRLFRYFSARGFAVCGTDISADMLSRARLAAKAAGGHIRLEQADIRSLPFAPGSFDLVVCLRFLNLVDPGGLEQVLGELSRLSRDKLLIGIRYVAPVSEIERTTSGAARLAARPILLARALRRRLLNHSPNAKAHRKDFLVAVLDGLNLEIVQARYVDRRWDNTDYVLWLIQKRS